MTRRSSIHIEEATISRELVIKGELESIWYRKCTFLADVIFTDVEVFSTVSFIECTFEGTARVQVLSGTFHDSVLLGFKKLSKFYLKGGKFTLLHLGYWGSKTSVKEIGFENLHDIAGNIVISKCQVEKFFIRGENVHSKITIRDTTVNSLNLYSLNVEAPIRMYNVGPFGINDKPSEFNIWNCNLGSSEFYNVDFDGFDSFNIRESFVADTKFISCLTNKLIKAEVGINLSNPIVSIKNNITSLNGHLIAYRKFSTPDVDLPAMEARIKFLEEVELPNAIKKEARDQIRYRRENYKQLKISAQNNGDSVSERRFHALEMAEYLKMPMPCSDKIIILLSKWSSNFGQSLWRPFLFHILSIHLILFILFFGWFNTSHFYFSLESHSWDATYKGFKEFLFLISPFRDLTLINPGILDLFFRANAGFFLYNFLRATRKFYQ